MGVYKKTVARVIARQGKFDHIKEVLKELHWLPIENRVTFKLSTLTYNIESTDQPVYLGNLLSYYEPVCTPRSSSKRFLTANVADTVLAMRGFRHSAVAVWNRLPDNIRSSANIDIFKRWAKNNLFNTSFAT